MGSRGAEVGFAATGNSAALAAVGSGECALAHINCQEHAPRLELRFWWIRCG